MHQNKSFNALCECCNYQWSGLKFDRKNWDHCPKCETDLVFIHFDPQPKIKTKPVPFLCLIGFHKWRYIPAGLRKCQRCPKKQGNWKLTGWNDEGAK